MKAATRAPTRTRSARDARCVAARRAARRAPPPAPSRRASRRPSRSQYENGPAPRRKPKPGHGVLGRAQRSHPRARAAQARRAGAAARPALHAQERPPGRSSCRARTCRSSASASPSRRAATTRQRDDAGRVRLRRGDAPPRHQDPQRRRHLARDRLRRRLARRAGHERGHHRRLLGAVEGRQAVPRPAVRHPAAPVVPRERDGRGARPDAGRGRRALRQPARAGERALRQPAVRREASRRVGADAPRTSARSPRARLETFWKTFYRPNHAILAVAGDVDAAQAARRQSRRRSAAGRAARCRRGRPGRSPSSTATRILLVDRPDLDAGDDRARPSRDQARRSALVRGDADELRAGRLGLLVAPDDRGARQARAHLRHRLVVRRARCTRASFRVAGVDEERDDLGGAARVGQRDPAHEDGRARRRSSWTRPRATTPAATRSSCRPPRASRRRWSPPSCTASASATCASCRCGWRPSTRRRPRPRRPSCSQPDTTAGRHRRQGGRHRAAAGRTRGSRTRRSTSRTRSAPPPAPPPRRRRSRSR